jgi:hypothetical protein
VRTQVAHIRGATILSADREIRVDLRPSLLRLDDAMGPRIVIRVTDGDGGSGYSITGQPKSVVADVSRSAAALAEFERDLRIGMKHDEDSRRRVRSTSRRNDG